MMNLLRLLKVLLRGLRPISVSLASIAVSLDTMARIQSFNLARRGITMPDPKLMEKVGKDDYTEISYEVKEAPKKKSPDGTVELDELEESDYGNEGNDYASS